MVTISISAEAYRAIAGVDPAHALSDERGGYRFIVDHKTLDRLTALRGPARATPTSSCGWSHRSGD
jgi:hypothetical protein